MTSEKALLCVFNDRDPAKRCDDLVLFLPRICTVCCTENITPYDLKIFPEPIFHLPLPLEGKICGSNEENTGNEAPDLQLLNQKTGHDGFPCTRVVCKEETDSRGFQEVIIYCFELVREWIDAGNGEGKIGIIFVGKAKSHRFDSEPEPMSVPIEGWF